MRFDIAILIEVWLPYDRNDWKSDITDADVGNFIHVKFGRFAKYRLCRDEVGNPKYAIIFPADITMKLHKATIFKHLSKNQHDCFHNVEKSSQLNIYYYGFDKELNWKKNGGCCLMPMCQQPQCETMACQTHLDVNKKSKPPTQFKMVHPCGFDGKNQICLLSTDQMIVSHFLKTQSTNILKMQTYLQQQQNKEEKEKEYDYDDDDEYD